MLILAVDTSTRAGSLAILSDRQVIATVDDSQEIPYAERVFRDLAMLQAEAGFSLKDVDVFAVAAGPGSFTALRVGLSVIKAWAEVYDRPIAAISGLEAVAAQSQAESRYLAPFLDARRGSVFGAVYRREDSDPARLSLVSPEAILGVEEFLAVIEPYRRSEPTMLISPTPNALAGEASPVGRAVARIEQVSAVLAPAIGLLGFERAARGELVSALELDANYVRRSDAEVKRNP